MTKSTYIQTCHALRNIVEFWPSATHEVGQIYKEVDRETFFGFCTFLINNLHTVKTERIKDLKIYHIHFNERYHQFCVGKLAIRKLFKFYQSNVPCTVWDTLRERHQSINTNTDSPAFRSSSTDPSSALSMFSALEQIAETLDENLHQRDTV
jgi:hypothetical protein